MPNIQGYLIALITGVFLGAIPMHQYDSAMWDKETLRLNKEAHAAKEKAVKEVQDKFDALLTKKDALEKEHATLKETNDAIYRDNQRLARERGMRDPGFGQVRAGAEAKGSGAPSCPANPSTEGRLSEATADFLLGLVRRCDVAATWANTCDRWLEDVENALK